MSKQTQLYLASRSPRRQELLRQIGITFEVVSQDADESLQAEETASDYVCRLAAEKSDAALQNEDLNRDLPILAADTIVFAGGRILGKPECRDHALAMLGMLSGNIHQVLTAVSMRLGEEVQTRLSISEVTFKPLSLLECERYWETGEPADKAGGYGIQGVAASWIKNITGSYSGVMGLPLYETGELLRAFDIEII